MLILAFGKNKSEIYGIHAHTTGELVKPVSFFDEFKTARMISLLVSKSYNEQPFVKLRMFGIWCIVCNYIAVKHKGDSA